MNQLINAFLAGTTSPAEEAQVLAWFREQPSRFEEAVHIGVRNGNALTISFPEVAAFHADAVKRRCKSHPSV